MIVTPSPDNSIAPERDPSDFINKSVEDLKSLCAKPLDIDQPLTGIEEKCYMLQSEKNFSHPIMQSPDELWVKIGGDKGGGNLKMVFQVANTPKPNSAQETITFAGFEGSDNHSNLSTALSNFKTKVQEMRSMAWKDKNIRVFFLFWRLSISGEPDGHFWIKWSTPLHLLNITRNLMQVKKSDHPAQA